VGLEIITLALGFGAAIAVFSIADSILRRPLPVRDQDRLVLIDKFTPRGDPFPFPIPDLEAIDGVAEFQSVGGVQSDGPSTIAVGWRQAGFQARITGVSGDFFRVLDSKPALGRVFQTDRHFGRNREVVISYRLWQREFGGDRSIIGQTITIYRSFTIVGVAARDLDFPHRTDIWATYTSPPEMQKDRDTAVFSVVGRLRPGVAIPQIVAATNRFVRQREVVYGPGEPRGQFVRARSLLDAVVGNGRTAVWMFAIGVGLLLALSLANATGLELIRSIARARELAVRAAIGATRGDVIRQLTVDSLAIGLIATAVGAGLGAAGVRILSALAPDDIPRLAGAVVRWRILGFAAVAAAAISLVVGLVAGLLATRSDPFADLRSGTARGPRRAERVGEWLLAGQIAFAVSLTVASGVLLRSWHRLVTEDLGFEPVNLVSLHLARVAVVRDAPELLRHLEASHRILDRLASIPGIDAVAASTIEPFSGPGGWTGAWTASGQDQSHPDANPVADVDAVSPRFFRTAGVRIVGGREYEPADLTRGEWVAIVNQSLARRAWPNQDPIGRPLHAGRAGIPNPPLTIIGVVEDSRYRRLDEVRPTIYIPAGATQGDSASWTIPDYLAIRTKEPAAAIARLVSGIVREEDPTRFVVGATTLQDAEHRAAARPRFNAFLLTLISIVALGLTAIGALAVISAWVQRRTRELGIRIAIGATQATLARLILGRVIPLVALGAGFGLVAAALATRLVGSLLYQVSPLDPLVLVGVTVLVLGVTTAAAIIPARRAGRVDPLIVLTAE
jgi:predicted permease